MLNNKIFLITGASEGLGKALAINLSKQNAKLALFSRNNTKLKETAALCQGNPLIITGDVTSELDCKNAINETILHYKTIDHLILNAGISMWSYFDKLANLAPIHQLIQTNYLGAVNCTYYALPFLKKNKGMITVISSLQGKIGAPFHTGYSASKHALEGFFNSLRLELNNEVDILMVSPGWISDTNLKQNAVGKSTEEKQIKRKHKQAISLELCTNEIISSIKKRKRELILPKKYKVVSWLKLIAPAYLDSIIMRAIKK